MTRMHTLLPVYKTLWEPAGAGNNAVRSDRSRPEHSRVGSRYHNHETYTAWEGIEALERVGPSGIWQKL